MGMLMHHTWLAQQQEKAKPKKVEQEPAEEQKKSAEEPVKRVGRPKTGK